MPSYTLNNSKELNTVSGSSTRTNEWKKTFTQKKIQISMYIPVCVNVCACVSVMCMYGCSSMSIIWILLWTKHGGSNVQTVRWCYSAGIRSVGASPASAVPTHTHPPFILLSAAHLHRGFTGDKEESVSFSDTPLSPVITLNKSCFQLHALHDCYSIFITHSVQPWMLPRMRRHKCLTWIKHLSLTEQLPNMWN